MFVVAPLDSKVDEVRQSRYFEGVIVVWQPVLRRKINPGPQVDENVPVLRNAFQQGYPVLDPTS